MKFVRWDPFQELVAMSDRLNRPVTDAYTPRTEDSFGAWVPSVDIFERTEGLVIRAEVAGVLKEDMDVRIENGVLTLRGKRKQATDMKEETAFRRERVHGEFTRSFSLPTTVDAERVSATCAHGVLEMTVPKAETAKPKMVEIKGA